MGRTHGWWVAGLVAVGMQWFVASPPAEAQISRGRRILLDRGLQIQTLVFFSQPGVADIDIDRWLTANFTAINFWEAQDPALPGRMPAGTPWSRQYVAPVPSTYLYPQELGYVEHLVALQYEDEIQDFSDAKLAEIAAAYRDWNAAYPDTLAYTNFGGPSGLIEGADLDRYMGVTRPDMLSFDVYPHRYGTPLASWYTVMQKCRDAALSGYVDEAGVSSGPLPYAQYLNSARTAQDIPLPTASFIRLQQNASWAFGYTFVTEFVYNSYNASDVSSVMFSGMGDAAPTPVFDFVKETNRQSLNLGPALVRLVSTDVRFVTGRHPNSNLFDANGDANALPQGLTRGSASTGWGHGFITGVTVENLGDINQQSYLLSKRSLDGDVLLGFFKVLDESFEEPGAAEEAYFMVVNGLTENEGAPAGDTRQRITLHFDFGASGLTTLQRLSRDTGLVEEVSLIHDGGSLYHLDLILHGGEGDLFKFNTGSPFVPEPASIAVMGGGLMWLSRWRR